MPVKKTHTVALIFFSALAFFVCNDPEQSQASVWESRDEEIVLAEGLVEGTAQYTVVTLWDCKNRIARHLKAHPDPKLELLFTKFDKQLALLVKKTEKLMIRMKKIRENPDKHGIIRKDDIFVDFYRANVTANDTMLQIFRDLTKEPRTYCGNLFFLVYLVYEIIFSWCYPRGYGGLLPA